MGQYTTAPCEDCGRAVTKQTNGQRARLCIRCAEVRVEKNARDIATKRGPGYRRWKAGQLVYLTRLMRGEDYPAIRILKDPQEASATE